MTGWDAARCDDCGILLDRHGEECGFEIGDPNAPEYGRPAGWLNVGTGQFTPIDPDYDPFWDGQ